MWLLMIAAPAAACEWLLRRYRPRLRWSLRTMLTAVGLAAALCGWFAAVRHRASLQDPIIAARRGPWGPNWVSVKRWGPKWLDLLGFDPFRRRIVEAHEGRLALQYDIHDDVRFMEQLAQLPTLESLVFTVTRLTPDMAESLNGMRRLRRLAITLEALGDDDVSASARLPPIGKLDQLEVLSLEGLTIAGDSLTGLANLKSLGVQSGHWREEDETIWRDCLAAIGKLTQLEHLELWNMKISGEGLTCLAALTKLKTLRLGYVHASEPCLISHLPLLPRLEAIDLGGLELGDEDIPRLVARPRLKSLEVKATSLTLAGWNELLSHPNIVINGDFSHWVHDGALDWFDGVEDPERPCQWLPVSDYPWLTATERAEFEKQGGWARFDAARWQGKIAHF